MRCVLTPHTQRARHPARTELAEANQADTSDRVPVEELGAKRLRNETRRDLGVDAVVDQQPALNHPPEPCGHQELTPLARRLCVGLSALASLFWGVRAITFGVARRRKSSQRSWRWFAVAPPSESWSLL